MRHVFARYRCSVETHEFSAGLYSPARVRTNLLANQTNGGEDAVSWRAGSFIRTWLEYDLVAMAALVLGIAAVELLAFIIG